MSKRYDLDNVLYPIFRCAENGNQFWHEDTEIEYKRQIKEVFKQLIPPMNYDDINPVAIANNVLMKKLLSDIEKL